MRALQIIWMSLLLGWTQVSANEEVDDLLDRFFAWRLDHSPEFGTKVGINNHDDKLEQFTEEAFTQQKEEAEEFLAEANEIKTEDLEKQDLFSVEILKDLLTSFIEGYKYREYSLYNGVSTIGHLVSDWKNLIGWSKFRDESDYNNYLARLRILPQQLEQKQRLQEIAIEKKLTQPAEAMTSFIEQLRKENDTEVEDSMFYQPFKNIDSAVQGAGTSMLMPEGFVVVRDVVKPAWRNYLDFVLNQYVPNARPGIGVSSMEGGADYYAACLKWHLSVDMTPQEIHDQGLREVARIKAQMEKIMEEDGFNGTLVEYKAFLETDPDNFFNTSEEILEEYRSFIAETHGKLNTVLKNIPDIEVKVEALDNQYGPSGRYSEPPLDNSRPGTFHANVFFPKQRPKFNMYALALHEAEPGHHTQTAVSVENNIPNFRRAIEYRKYYAVPFNWLFHTAYSEGWALYAEALGEQMDAYTRPHALFGRYASEIHRATRLVVDTGIHAFNWSHSQTVEYMREYTTLSNVQVQNEVNRYISVPGQACAYKIGELKITELKNKAKRKLGDDFDLREFHDEVLVLGNAPLHVLEEHIDNWIEESSRTVSAAAILNAALWVQLSLFVLAHYLA